MNIIHKIIIPALALAVMSCTTDWMQESEHPMPEGTGAVPVFTFEGEKSLSVSKLGGDYEATVTSNLPWLAESQSSWILLTSPSRNPGGSAPEKVTFTVTKNASLEPRSGRIRLWVTNESEEYIDITQEAMTMEDLGGNWHVKPGGTSDGSSWEKACSLTKALEEALDADKILLAAGTYYPETVLPGGSEDADKTFYVQTNVKIFGGYPENPKDGDVADPKKYKSILSGGGTCYHVLVIGAPKSSYFKVEIDGVTIKDGSTAATGTGNVKVNGATCYRFYGGGVVNANSTAALSGCTISDNKSVSYCAGIYNADGGDLSLIGCEISRNTGGNGTTIFNSASILRMDGCTLSDNSCTGVGCGVYNFDASGSKRTSVAYIANSFFSNNATDASAASRRGGGYYGREGSEGVIINSTFERNVGGNGGGIAVYGTTAYPAKLTVVSCTITGNEAKNNAGGLEYTFGQATVNVYNSIISGNKAVKDAQDLAGTVSYNTSTVAASAMKCNIIGDSLYPATEPEAGKTFNPGTMFGELNGGVFPLAGTGNPALTDGMTAGELKALTTNISVDFNAEDLVRDQKGNPRTGRIAGAYVGN